MTLRWRFIAEKDVGSRAISWFGGGQFSHVDLVMPDGQYAGARTAIDKAATNKPGYQLRPADYIKAAVSVVMSLEVTAEQEVAVYKASNAKLGDPYDHLAIWGFVLGRNWEEPGSWICSEAQAQNITCAGICKPLYLTANRITPNDLTLILSALGATWSE
jgi:hypothetical protein